MSDLQQFREKVTIYRKRQDTFAGNPHTQQELAKTLGLSADELGHRLRGTGRSPLTRENVLAIVRTLAAWETLSWDEAVHLLMLMDYPLDPPDWKTELQRFLAPPAQSVHPPSVTIAGAARERPSVPAFAETNPQAREGVSLPVRHRLFQARDLPKGYVPRPKAFDEIKQLLLNPQNHRTTAITTALRGAGGFGKTTLALALCHDPEIQAAFPDGILWVELGEQPLSSLNVLNGVLHALEPSLSEAVTLEEARDHWRTALHERVCLLVIDDVWQKSALEALLEGGSHCARLVTTRNDQVLPEEVARILVDAMESQEALAMLCRGLPQEIQQAVYQPRLEALAKQLGYWPLLLGLANSMLTFQVSYGRGIAGSLTVLEEEYRTRGVMAFHLGNATERQQAVEACIEVSLRHLEEFTLARYHARKRYQELAIFPEDIDIPLAMLQTFWQASGGLSDRETEELCMSLHGLSLLLTCDLGSGTFRLHDVMRNYLQQCAKDQLSLLHAHFLKAHWHRLRLTCWADLPADELYLWHFLLWHLCRAARWEELYKTLTDLYYLARKALVSGVVAMEADIMQVSAFIARSSHDQHSSSERSMLELSILPLLLRLVRQVSHLLLHAPTLAEMGGLLLNHWGEEPLFAAQRTALEQKLPRPFLVAWHPIPGRPSSSLLRTLRGHTSPVRCCAIGPDSRFIISGSDKGTLKVWDAASGAERLTLRGHTTQVMGCAISPDGSYIVSASSDSTLKVWDAATGAERLTLRGHIFGVSDCAISPDGSYIVSASSDHTLKVWDAASGAERLTLRGHTGRVDSCAISPDGSYIVSSADGGTLKVWDAATGAERLTLRNDIPPQRVTDCAISPDGSYIVSSAYDGTLKVWDAATGAERPSLKCDTGLVHGCAISPDGSYIVSASSGYTLKVLDAVTGAERLTLRGHTDGIDDWAISSDANDIVSASDDYTLKIWDISAKGASRSFQSYSGPMHDCAISPDGSYIVSASSDGTLKVWDAATGAERLTLKGHTHDVYGCAISPDGSYIVSASRDDTLKVWDAATGAERLTLKGHTYSVNGCAVSPDGSYIVSASSGGVPQEGFDLDQMLKVWDAVTGAEQLTLFGHTDVVWNCAISPDGSYIVSASWDRTLKVWDAASGAERLTLKGHTDGVNGCAISPDGSYIVSASWDQTLKVWDATTGAERLTLKGHTDIVWGCAISPDGNYIVSTSKDQTLKVWERQSGRCVLNFPVDGELQRCVFHPDGEHLVACGMQGLFFLRLVVQADETRKKEQTHR